MVVQYSTAHYGNIVWYSMDTMVRSTVWYSTVHYGSTYSTVQYSTVTLLQFNDNCIVKLK